jgi:DNA mismatch repair protein MutS2
MGARLEAGAAVQTPFGKGVVREVRNGGRLLVDVGGRALVVSDTDVTALESPRREDRSARRGARERRATPRVLPGSRPAAREVDLHGLTVEEALARVESALNDAILADMAQVRFIHGRSSGRIRGALHRRLKEIATVRHFLVDPRNDGVTIVEL